MNEHDLLQLRSVTPAGLPDCRPVADVLARGTRLRRRRHAARTAGATAVVGSLLAAGVLAAPDGPDTTTGPGRPKPPTGVLPAPVPLCEPTVEPVPFTGDEGLALLPTWLPAGVEVDAVAMRRTDTACPTPGPALALLQMGAEGLVAGRVLVHGPFDGWAALPERPRPIEVRGVDAGIVSYDDAGIRTVDVVWTEPDGASWWITGDGIGEQEARAIADALVLDTHPGSTPAAGVPADRLPQGWEVAWQAPDTPEVGPATRLSWDVSTTDDRCHVSVTEPDGAAPAVAFAGHGDVRRTIDGHDTVLTELGDGFVGVRWSEPSGTEVGVSCRDLPEADVLRVAASLEPVSPGDPRLPDTDAAT